MGVRCMVTDIDEDYCTCGRHSTPLEVSAAVGEADGGGGVSVTSTRRTNEEFGLVIYDDGLDVTVHSVDCMCSARHEHGSCGSASAVIVVPGSSEGGTSISVRDASRYPRFSCTHGSLAGSEATGHRERSPHRCFGRSSSASTPDLTLVAVPDRASQRLPHTASLRALE